MVVIAIHRKAVAADKVIAIAVAVFIFGADIYPKGDSNAMQQVEQMREDGRVDMYAEADYSEGTTAYMWITNRIQKMADRIRDTEKAKITNSASSVPKHLV